PPAASTPAACSSTDVELSAESSVASAIAVVATGCGTETGCALDADSQMTVTIGHRAIAPNVAQAATYRACDDARRSINSTADSNTAATAPCHTKCSSVQPSTSMTSLSSGNVVVITRLQSHLAFFSNSSSIRRISASSSREARLADNACNTNCRAEPPKARSSKSLTSCRCVVSADATAA